MWSDRGSELSRRRFLVGVAGAAALVGTGPLLAACGGDDDDDASSGSGSGSGSGGETTGLTTQLSWVKNVEFAGWWIALTRNMYTDAGIDAEFLSGETSSSEAVVAGGGAPIGISGNIARVTDAIREGGDLVVYGTQYQVSPDAMLSLPDNPIRTPEDIIGKRIGVTEGAQADVDTILKIAGLPLDYEAVTVGFDPDPLVQGAVDGYTAFIINQAVTLDLQDVEHVATTYSDLGYPQYAGLLFGDRKWVADNHDLLVAHTKATLQGWEIAVVDTEAAVDASLEVGKDLGLDREQQTLEHEKQLPLMQSDVTRAKGLFYVDKDFIDGTIYPALEASGRSDLPDVNELVDLMILEDVYQGKTTVG